MESGVIYYEYEKRKKFEDYDLKVDAELGTFKIRRHHFGGESFVHPLHSVRFDLDRPYEVPIEALMADQSLSSFGTGTSSTRGSHPARHLSPTLHYSPKGLSSTQRVPSSSSSKETSSSRRRVVMKPVPTDITGRVRSGSGRRERKERKDRNKTYKVIAGPDAYATVEPWVRIIYVGGTPKRLFRHRCVRIQSFYAIVAVLYRTWFATVTTSTSAWGPSDSRFDPDCTGDSEYSWESGAESRTPSNTCTYPVRGAVLSTTTTKASPPERACHVFGTVAGEAKYLSHSDPSSLLFDPLIERTLRRTRQARRRAELARLALNNNPFSDSSSDTDT
ncbi:hypothetical protein PIB30_065715 [Stylosanthes scabra]|uniref:Uncharacterized protein n=1 Tax=Stylosanthes scabra TaxID=79078 RepID=A0ABU6YLI4_9FABA|nr:hypothetical protein [Stylosanthes scabra]